MTSSSKETMMIYGATGVFGRPFFEGLLQRNHFDLHVITRSADNEHIIRWTQQGVRAHIVNVPSASHEQLVELLQGVDYLVSFVGGNGIESQKQLFRAAKDAKVARVVPSDFSISCPPGLMLLHDVPQKLGVRDYVRSIGVPHTFIEMGAVTEGLLPRPADDTTSWGPVTWRFAGDGDKPIAVTAIETMPDWLVRIVADPRTLNHEVFISEDEVTLSEVWDIVAKQPGGAAILERKSPFPAEEVTSQWQAAKAAYEKEPSLQTAFGLAFISYINCVYVRGHNTRENAKRSGALDARELYPDVPPVRTTDFAEKWYRNPTLFGYDF